MRAIPRSAARAHDPGPRASAAADRRRMLTWLGEAATRGDGAVLSWVNPEHPGYAYPEAAGLLLALLAQEPGAEAALARRIAARLAADVDERGAVGRGGIAYLFDSGIALHGLLLFRSSMLWDSSWGAAKAIDGACERLFAGIVGAIDRREPLRPAPSAPPRWSEAWGCHLLKLALPLRAHVRVLGRGQALADAALDRLTRELAELAEGGRHVTHAGAQTTYVHACCYAAEGLLAVDPAIDPGARGRAAETAAWLASIQGEDGRLPAWHDGERGEGPFPADVVAQSVRIWCAVDRRRFAPAIDRGLARLGVLQAPSGGLRYTAGSADINTWATVFAAQALAWASGDEGRAPWLI